MYEVLSLVYDPWQKSYGKDYTTLVFPRLLASIDSLNIPTSTMLDVACGTGTLALKMARRGWKVWGIDRSPGMLKHAAAKAATSKLPVAFTSGAMQTFDLHRQFPLVTCMFDSLNHILTKRELFKTFRNVARHLFTGGYFIFDVNNEQCFMTIWRQPYATTKRGFTLVLDNHYVPSRRRARSDVSLFLKKGREFEQRTEVIHERCYSSGEIAGLLGQAGFTVLVCEDFNFTDVPEVGRVKTWWVVQRVSKGGRVSSRRQEQSAW